MKRRAFLATSALTLSAGCGLLPGGGSGSAGVSTVHWPGELNGGGQAQFAPSAAPGTDLSRHWTVDPGMNEHYGGGQLLSADGLVYTSLQAAMGSSVVAVDPEAGEVEWTSEFQVTDLGYVDGKLVGLSENGTLILDAATGERAGLVSEVAVPSMGEAAGTVTSAGYYVAVLEEETVAVVDVAEASVAWQQVLGGHDKPIADVVVRDETLFVWRYNGDQRQNELLVHDLASGDAKATHEFPDLEFAMPAYLTADEDVIVAGVPRYPSVSSRYNFGFVAVDHDGAVQWTTTDVRPNGRATTTNLDPAPALDDTHLYVREENTVRALDRTSGDPVWKFTGANPLSNCLAVSGDTVFTADARGEGKIRVHAIDTKTGDATVVAVEKAGSNISSGITEVLPSKRGLFVGSEHLYHLE